MFMCFFFFLQSGGKIHSILGKIACLIPGRSLLKSRTVQNCLKTSLRNKILKCYNVDKFTMDTKYVNLRSVRSACGRELWRLQSNNRNWFNGTNTLKLVASEARWKATIEKSKARIRYWEWKRVIVALPSTSLDTGRRGPGKIYILRVNIICLVFL